MKELREALRPAALALAVFTLACGVIYPLVLTGIALPFPDRTHELVGQPFDDPRFFWGRLTAIGYNAATSSGVNQGPLAFVDEHGHLGANPALLDAANARIAALAGDGPVPIDLVTASASGLDPDISPAAAYYQVARVAKARGVPEDRVRALVDNAIEERTLGILGERRVNVVRLNQALDGVP